MKAAVAVPPIESARRDTIQHTDIERADAMLRGAASSAAERWTLAERLRKQNELGRARRLYGLIRDDKDSSTLDVTVAKVGHQHALATYSDPDLPAAERFAQALTILDEVDRLDLTAPSPKAARSGAGRSRKLEILQRQESLALRGAIHQRRWQVEGQRTDLERACGFFSSGFELGKEFQQNRLGVETDQGYSGIHAAFVLNLLASEEAREARFTRSDASGAQQRFQRAQTIRGFLEQSLAQLPREPGFEWLNQQWWFHATLAEAQLGLGDFESAIASLRRYNVAHGLSHEHPPIPVVPRWELESTLSRLASVADTYAQLQPLLEPDAATADWTARFRRAFDAYLGPYAPAMDRVELGKVGLALSGGGLRAALFHLGVLAQLAERDMLRRVEVLSCVSGGSIVGAHFYLEVQQLLRSKSDAEVTAEDYCEIVARMCEAFLAGVQTNLRSQVSGSVWANLRALFQPSYTTTRKLGELYESVLYAKVSDQHGSEPRYLPDLKFTPAGESKQEFNPKYDNWRRRAKLPVLVLNATTLNTGHNWQFTASFMGESPHGLDAEIEGNYRLRRLYYPAAPPPSRRWLQALGQTFAPPDYRRMRLGEAVAASSCLPGLFEPLALPDLYEGKNVRLGDGSVFDSQGVASLLEQDCDVLIISDGSGQMGSVDQPALGRLGVPLRSFDISTTRVRQAQQRDLCAREQAGLLRRHVFMHLKRDLESEPVDWRECQDPFCAYDRAAPSAQRGLLTTYQIHKSVQRLLSVLRTDLDSFNELEANALMTCGYRQAAAQLGRRSDWPVASVEPKAWAFLEVERLLAPGPHFEEVKRLLWIGGFSGYKVFLTSPFVAVLGALMPMCALLYLLYEGWMHRASSSLSAGDHAAFLLVLGVCALAPQLAAILRYGHTVRAVGLGSLGSLLLAPLFKLHLLTFDRLFLAKGRLSRFRSAQRD